MHNLKEIRKDFENFKIKLKNRNIDLNIDNLKDLDEKNRKLIQKKEILESEKKEISKSKDESLFKKSKEISIELDLVTEKQKKIKNELESLLSNIPNIPHKDVPNGKNEDENIEVSRSGKIPEFDFNPKTHYELGENLRMLDFDLATKTTGSRFVFVKKKVSFIRKSTLKFYVRYSHFKKWL